MDGGIGPSVASSAIRATEVNIRSEGRGYRLTSSIFLPHPIGSVFEFFAEAGNLNTITPDWMRFRILTPLPVVMRPGLLLDYRLQIHGIPMDWQTEITVWDPPHRFVDEQRKGPYRSWVHEHLFRTKDSGTEVIDRVDYVVPGGRLVHQLFVKGDVTSIFQYRQRKLMDIFRSEAGGDRVS